MKTKLTNVLRWLFIMPMAVFLAFISNLLWSIFILFLNKLFINEYIPISESNFSNWLIIISGMIGGIIFGYVFIAVIYWLMPNRKKNAAKVVMAVAALVILFIGFTLPSTLMSGDYSMLSHDLAFLVAVVVMAGKKNFWFKTDNLNINNLININKYE